MNAARWNTIVGPICCIFKWHHEKERKISSYIRPGCVLSESFFLKDGLSESHPRGGKSSTGMALPILRKSGELFNESVDIVPATLSWWTKFYVGGVVNSFSHIKNEKT